MHACCWKSTALHYLSSHNLGFPSHIPYFVFQQRYSNSPPAAVYDTPSTCCGYPALCDFGATRCRCSELSKSWNNIKPFLPLPRSTTSPSQSSIISPCTNSTSCNPHSPTNRRESPTVPAICYLGVYPMYHVWLISWAAPLPTLNMLHPLFLSLATGCCCLLHVCDNHASWSLKWHTLSVLGTLPVP